MNELIKIKGGIYVYERERENVCACVREKKSERERERKKKKKRKTKNGKEKIFFIFSSGPTYIYIDVTSSYASLMRAVKKKD